MARPITERPAAEPIGAGVPRPSGPALRPLMRYVLPPALALALAAAACEAWTRLANVPTYIFPAPSAVAGRLFGDAGYFAVHGAVTVLEAAAGFVVGSAIAVALGVAMSYSRAAERTLLPIALLVKVTPVVAVAPLFVIWFGFGSGPKVLIAALITFFPVMVNTLIGLRSVSPGALDFLRSLDASDFEILLKLRAPSALPYLFAAFRIAVPLSVIGAVVGEWFTGDRGLGSVIIVAHNNIDMPTLFAAVVTLAAIGVTLTAVLAYAERKVLFWHESFITT